MNVANSPIFLLLSWVLIGCSAASDHSIVREDGIGPAKIGVTLAQLSSSLHLIRPTFCTPQVVAERFRGM
jgi:hypothetical protein